MAGFLTGFITGAANRANEITQDNERQRNAVIERSMQAFRASIERRQERDRELSQQLAQAQILGHRVGGAGNAEAIVRAGLGPQLLSGQITMGGQPNAAPTPAPITGQGGLMAPPSATPTAPTAPGLGQPSRTPVAPSGDAPVAPQMGDPRDAISATPTAPQQQPQASPEAPQGGGVIDGIRRAVFGRNPFEGVGEEVRNRYMQETGMGRPEMDRLMAQDRPIPQVQGQVNVAPVAPADMARLSQHFRDSAGMQRFVASGGQDTSGLINFADQANLQREIASLRGAGRGSNTQMRPADIHRIANHANTLAGQVLGAELRWENGIPRFASQNAELNGRATQLGMEIFNVMSSPEYNGDIRLRDRAVAQAARNLGMQLPDTAFARLRLSDTTNPGGGNTDRPPEVVSAATEALRTMQTMETNRQSPRQIAAYLQTLPPAVREEITRQRTQQRQ